VPALRPHHPSHPRLRACRSVLLLLGSLLFATACTNPKLLDAQAAYRAGNAPAARDLIDRVADKSANGNDRLLAHLNQGAIALATGDPAAARDAFANAQEDARFYDQQPDASLSAEFAATFANLNALPYRGRPHDLIMLDTYQALLDLERGDTPAARVELRQALNRQRDAAATFAQQIEQEQAALAATRDRADRKPDARTGRVNLDRSLDNPRLDQRLATLTPPDDLLTPYSDFVNPFTETLRGIVALHAPADSADHEAARFALDRAIRLVPNHPHLQAALNHATALAQQGAPAPPLTHAFFFAGTAPFFTPFRIDLPLFFFNDRVDYVGVNFPAFTPSPRTPGPLSLQNEWEQSGRSFAASATALTLADFDRIIAADYHARLPGIVTRTLLNAAAKAAAAYAINEATRGDELANTIARILTTAYQAIANQADLRTWAALPQRIDYANLPTPAQGKITLDTPRHAPLTVNVEPDRANIVLVFSPHPSGDVAVYSFPIAPAQSPADLSVNPPTDALP